MTKPLDFLILKTVFSFITIPQEAYMSLTELQRGQKATITAIPDESMRVQLLRFGITCGSEICCHCKLPFGPVVLKFSGQEIALGRKIASLITVQSSR